MKERQVSFAGGELSPQMWGRSDLDIYKAGAKKLTNFLVTQEGVLINRAGTQHVADVPEGSSRLIRYSLERGRHYIMHFYAKSSSHSPSIDLYTSSGRYDFSNPDGRVLDLIDEVDDLNNFRFAQRTGELIISLTNENLTGVGVMWSVKETDSSLVSYDWYTLETPNRTGTSLSRLRYLDTDEYAELTSIDSTHPARPWTWAVSHVVALADGSVLETLAREILAYHVVGGETDESPEAVATLSGKEPLYADRIRTIWTPYSEGDTVDLDRLSTLGDLEGTVITTRLYRGREGRLGFIAESVGTTIDDDGAVPDWANPPRLRLPPWSPYWYDQRTRPRALCFFEGRLLLGGMTDYPDRVYGSSIRIFDNFDEVILADDSDAMSFDMLSNDDDTVNWMIGARNLMVFTSTGEWVVTGTGVGEPITPNSIAAHPVSKHGSSDAVPPVELDNAVVFLQAIGSTPRIMFPGQNGYEGKDLSRAARHFFDGLSVVAWAYAEHPHSILYVVMDDGTLLACTLVPEIGIVAWSRIVLSGEGVEVLDVATKPETNETGVYLLVSRDTGITIERFAKRLFTDLRDGVFLDQCVTYDGFTDEVPVITDSYSYEELGDFVAIALPSSPDDLVGTFVRLDDPDGGEPVLLLIDTDLGGDDYKAQVYNIALPSWAWTDDAPVTLASGYWACRTSVSGLNHLNGQVVKVVADSIVYEGITVVAGSASIGEDNPSGILHAGLPYNSDFESLNIVQGRGKQKIVERVTVELDHARGGSVGNTLDDLISIRTRTRGDAYEAPSLKRIDAETIVRDQWAKHGRCAIRQADPMPMTIVGFTREYKEGG